MKKKSKSLTLLWFFLILLLGLFLRLRHWPDFLTFDYEKARDLIASRNIYLNKKPTLLGPVSEVEGIFHGPLYYYLAGFFYYVFRGDPRAGSVVSFFFNLSNIVVIFLLGKEFFDKRVALIASFIYAVSFEAISYTYWLSNPGPSVPFLFLMFFFFYKFLTGKNWKFLALSFFCFGLAIQFQILNVIFGCFLILFYFLSAKPKISFSNFLFSILFFFFPISSFFIFDIKHQFLMTNAFIKTYLLSGGGHLSLTLSTITSYFSRLADEIRYIIFPSVPTIALPLMVLLFGFLIFKILSSKKNFVWKYLLAWVFATIPIFFLDSRMSESQAAFIGISAAIILVLAYLVNEISLKARLVLPILLVLIFLSNLTAIDDFLTNPEKRLFDFFEGLFWKNNLALIEYVYKETGREKFRVDTVTSPLFISPLWDYLIEWYGEKNHQQLPKRDDQVKFYFLIIEPYVDSFYKETAMKNNSHKAKLIKSETFGRVVVQKWISLSIN